MSIRYQFITIVILLAGIGTRIAAASDYDLSWHTIDGGGGYSAGGSFELEGTIGQPDAGIMSGGDFQLTGGFWPLSIACNCPGDMNGDGMKNGNDIQQFVNCVIAGGNCACADVDGINGFNLDDVETFVADLLAGESCS